MVKLLTWSACDQAAVRSLLQAYDLILRQCADTAPIPGSYWGDSEAGLKGSEVWVRNDTPLHSVLHEACHAICMGYERRGVLDTDAGGDDIEENAVCYLQICLAEQIPDFGAKQCCADMDSWGYSFRLGSARDWFVRDAQDAQLWLQRHHLWPSSAARCIQALTQQQC